MPASTGVGAVRGGDRDWVAVAPEGNPNRNSYAARRFFFVRQSDLASVSSDAVTPSGPPSTAATLPEAGARDRMGTSLAATAPRFNMPHVDSTDQRASQRTSHRSAKDEKVGRLPMAPGLENF